MEMIIEPTHRVLDGDVKIPEGIGERNLNAAPHQWIGSAQDDQKLMNEFRPTVFPLPRRCSTAHRPDRTRRLRLDSTAHEKIATFTEPNGG